jgi:NMD protein affecting ribosome stability and mRNA decay
MHRGEKRSKAVKELRKTHIGEQTERRDRLIKERVHDPYKTRHKLSEPTICPQCCAVWQGGRWQWKTERPEAEAVNEELCQACHRVNDRYPAGELTLSGPFLSAHRTEITHLVRNTEQLENKEHPLHRIMEIDDQGNSIVITTTDIHLPRRIAQAIFNAYEGDLGFHYDDEGYFIRATWSREA